VGFQDEIGLLSFYLGKDFFRLSPAEKEKWFADYLAAPDKLERKNMLRSLHYETLRNAYVIPVALFPYASVARKPWHFNFPEMVAGDHLWRLRRK
jgi:hypothetical protein